ncbi:MAG: DUF262 domain-containing protein [Clostridia bacterium]|nr:DUF262 domain-containing protein [Clostridia bacterium]
MSNIEIRTVLDDENDELSKSLQGLIFVIKEYQRGYRWEPSQIKALLNDIKDFKTHDGELKYCLQPLVVKKIKSEVSSENRLSKSLDHQTVFQEEADEIWELIDGQQRLTTVLLILDACYSAKQKLPYDVIYMNHRDIDKYYIEQAKSTITDWFEKFGSKEDDIKSEVRKKINSNIQFIWYEVSDSANSSEVFTKLNMGKIPLTNAELFKALLLSHNENDSDSVQRAKISFEWDVIEQSLHDDEFWYFISNENKEHETRIDYLLKLYALTHKTDAVVVESKINEDDNLFPFLVVNAIIQKGHKSVKEIWLDIVKIHDTLKMWYTNSSLYHKLGFLITVKGKSFDTINSFLKIAEENKKSKVNSLIDDSIKEVFKKVNLDGLNYNNVSHKKHIKNVLLYFNILTMLNSKTQMRFSFRQYKDEKQKWDIEHINARATEQELLNATTETARKELLEGFIEQLKYIGDNKTIKKIQNFITDHIKDTDTSVFVQFYNEINDIYGDFNENGLGNLTLLDAETNRSYKNALFAVKRKKIIEKDKGEVFIPVCTKNVFLKMYSDEKGIKNMLAWNINDAQNYLDEIKKVFIEEAKVICQLDKK